MRQSASIRDRNYPNLFSETKREDERHKLSVIGGIKREFERQKLSEIGETELK